MVSRRSCFFLPRANPMANFILPRTTYILNGTMVNPACFVLPCKRSISLAFSNNLRLRAGSASVWVEVVVNGEKWLPSRNTSARDTMTYDSLICALPARALLTSHPFDGKYGGENDNGFRNMVWNRGGRGGSRLMFLRIRGVLLDDGGLGFCAGFVIVGLPFAILLFYAFLACRVFGSEMTILARVCRQRFVYLYAVAFGYRGSGWFLASPDSGGCCFGCARRFDGIVYCRAVWQHQGFAPIIADCRLPILRQRRLRSSYSGWFVSCLFLLYYANDLCHRQKSLYS